MSVFLSDPMTTYDAPIHHGWAYRPYGSYRNLNPSSAGWTYDSVWIWMRFCFLQMGTLSSSPSFSRRERWRRHSQPDTRHVRCLVLHGYREEIGIRTACGEIRTAVGCHGDALVQAG